MTKKAMFRSDMFAIFAAFIVVLADANSQRHKYFEVVEYLSGFHYPNILHRQRNDIRSLLDCAIFSLSDGTSIFSFNERNKNCRTYSKYLCPKDGVVAEEGNIVYIDEKEKPKSCEDVGCAGIHVLSLCGVSVEVMCELDINGKLWTVIQRRFDRSVDFDRVWKYYKIGFGNLSGEFWLGNDHIHCLTKNSDQELRVEISDPGGKSFFAKYSTFVIGDEITNYQSNFGGYSGTAGDSLSYHSQTEFTTKDVDNDNYQYNCAAAVSGGWWYKYTTSVKCGKAKLNGNYEHFSVWSTVTMSPFDASTKMMIRKK